MTGWKRFLVWGVLVVGGLALVGLGVFFAKTGLDKADEWASVIGVFAALIGVGLAVYGVVSARSGATAPTHSSLGGGTDVNRDIHQQVQAGRDAYVAGRDQHFGTGGPGAR